MRLFALAASLPLLAACSGATSDVGSRRGTDGGPDEPHRRELPGSLPREVPQASFTGPGSGCSNILAYRGSTDGTQYAVIEIDKEVLGLDIGSTKTIDLGTNPEGVHVSIDVYASALGDEKPYCTDYGIEQPAMARWTAEAGKLTISLTDDPDSIDAKHPTYRATLHLETVHFVRPERGVAIVVPNVEIENVRVGWSPG